MHLSKTMVASNTYSKLNEPGDSDDGANPNNCNLESFGEKLRRVSFQNVERVVAKNQGRVSITAEDHEDDKLQVMTADAWDECRFHLRPFLLTYIYELLPSFVAQFVCWAVEGKASTTNRQLWYPATLIQDLVIRPQWVCLLIYIVYSPPGVSPLNLCSLFVLLSFRAASIGMKYAFLATSDLRLVQSSTEWNDANHVFRVLGAATHFNVAGTFYNDIMKEILVSALRAHVLIELPKRKFRLSTKAANMVWADVKKKLAEQDDAEKVQSAAMVPSKINQVQIRGSKFVDTKKLIGLADTELIEEEVSQGKLRASIAIYYFATREYAPTSRSVMLVLPVVALISAIASIMIRYYCNDFEDVDSATIAFYCVRFVAHFFAMVIYVLYLIYPILDASKRNGLGLSVLASIGHQQIRGDRLLDGHEDVALPLNTAEDMLAFWLLQRVLGSELYRGQAIRYNSAYLLTAFIHLVAMVVLLEVFGSDGPLEWAAAAEILILFVVGIPLVCTATLLAEMCNNQVSQTLKVLKRKSLDAILTSSDEKDDVIEHADLLSSNFEDVLPVQIFFMPATAEILSLVWAALGFLSSIVGKQMKSQLGIELPSWLF